jgi:hypothetical protein
MDGDDILGSSRDTFEHCVDLEDAFVEVGNGQIRRVTIPLGLIPVLGWIDCAEDSDFAPGDLHAACCRAADANGTGYAEAMVGVLTGIVESEKNGRRYRAAMIDPVEWQDLCDRHVDTQIARARRWAETNEWTDPLPPALD